MKTYIGKRVTTNHKLAFFFEDENKTRQGLLKDPGLPIGAICTDDFNPTGEMIDSESIAKYTTQELGAVIDFKGVAIAKRMKREQPNEIKKFIAYLKGLKVTNYEKSKILEVIRESINL